MQDADVTQAVLDSLHEQVVIVDREGTIVGCNKLWLRTAEQRGLADSSVAPGANYLSAIRRALHSDPALFQTLTGLLEVLDQSLESFESEYVCEHGGELRWYAQRATAIPSPGRNVVITHFDITERRLAEQRTESQRDEFRRAVRAATLGQLSGALAHELNQPLTAILTNAQVARNIAPGVAMPEELAEIFADIETDARRAGETIKRLRSLMETRETRFEQFDFNELVKDTLVLIKSDLLLNGVSVASMRGDEPLLVNGDSIELQHLLLNLFLNACQAMAAMPARKRIMEVSCSRLTPVHLRIIVRDHGSGISPANSQRAFEAFFTTKKQGLGLGLSICRSIVELHSGSISIANHEAGGAMVTVDLPLIQEDSGPRH